MRKLDDTPQFRAIMFIVIGWIWINEVELFVKVAGAFFLILAGAQLSRVIK